MQHAKHVPYSRVDRVANELQSIVAEFCIRELDDPRAQGIQITKVRLSKDLRLARINYFINGNPGERDGCQDALEQSKGAMKRAIGERLSIKFMPDLKFHFDDSVEHGSRIEEILKQIHIEPAATDVRAEDDDADVS